MYNNNNEIELSFNIEICFYLNNLKKQKLKVENNIDEIIIKKNNLYNKIFS